MKRTMLVIAGLLLTQWATAQELDLPKRKAGLWETRIDTGQLTDADSTGQLCIDDATDRALQKKFLSGGNSASPCKLVSSRKTDSTWEYDSVCKINNVTHTSHVVVSGDMQSAYQIDINSQMQPPQNGQTQMHSLIKASYLGACKPGMRPGEIAIHGLTLNLLADGKTRMSPEEVKKMVNGLKQAIQ